jgi:hypothetical protein
MSEQSPYEQLGVSEEASFEEIQIARDRMVAQYAGDRPRQEAVEAAYDAVLMDRLRMRAEGKIKVPDRIRFPERAVQPPATPAPVDPSKASNWLKHWADTPSPADIWLPAGVMAGLSTVVLLLSPPPLEPVLIVAVGASFYFLYRKERKLGRSVLLTLLGLFVGLIGGGLLSSALPLQLFGANLTPNSIAVIFTFVLFWLISSFLH